MAPITEAPKLSKKRKLGKGKKKAWRAAKIKDLEDFLDDERRQREAGGVVSEKKNEKLFFVDTGVHKKVDLPNRRISKEERRNRPLRSTALLEPSDHIKSVIAPLKENYRKGSRPQKILDSLKERATSKVRLEAAQQREDYVQEKRITKRQKRELPEVTTDIWNDDEADTAKVKRPKKLLDNKPSKLTATAVPHPGASINPSYEDHQDLLQKAVEVEELKRKKALKQVRRMKLPANTEVATPATHLAEMSAGLVDDSESEEEENDVVANGGDDEVQTSVRVPKRKSKRQRKAEAKLGEQMRNKKAEAERKRRENMVFRLRGLKSEIRQQEAKEKERVEVKLKLKEEEPYKTKRLGKMKFEEPDVDLKCSDELVPSLRQLKPEGNILDDVYTNMLKRNIMEPRAKQSKKRRYKLKQYIKKSHKEIT